MPAMFFAAQFASLPGKEIGKAKEKRGLAATHSEEAGKDVRQIS
jgi:hypothetical protein